MSEIQGGGCSPSSSGGAKGSPMSSLRGFRFQKTKGPKPPIQPNTITSSDSRVEEDTGNGNVSNGGGPPHPQRLNDCESKIENGKRKHPHDSSYNSDDESQVLFHKKKKTRVLSDDSESDASPIKNGSSMPSSELIERKLNFLVVSFPNKDRMELQDLLRLCDWNVEVATAKLTNLTPSVTSTSKIPKKKSIKAHEYNESGSESDNEEYSNNLVYDSDSDNEEEVSDHNISDDKRRVLKFFNDGTPQELTGISGCSKKKVDNIIDLRPFEGWMDLVKKIQLSRHLNTEMLNSTTVLLRMRDTIAKLMEKCHRITTKMEKLVEDLTNGDNSKMELTEQPKIIEDNFKLTSYQMIGLNWLVLMHKQSLNGILADEMGLGKTIQAISFLAHLKEVGDEGPHLIVVPSSTMDNWQKELTTWCPSIKLLNYYGSQDERRHMRLQIMNQQIEYDIILTTYNMVISSADDRVLFRKLDFHYVIFDEAHMLKNMATARYENLMRVKASRKLLLTGTPLQNNLVELMSLLVFVMPDMFANKKEQLKKMFSMFPKSGEDKDRSQYEKDRIAHAKRIMKPFILRRLKDEVLTDLPTKTATVEKLPMIDRQHEMYYNLVADYKRKAKLLAEGKTCTNNDSGIGMLMNLRKTANHPLLVRKLYDDSKIRKIARMLKQDASHREANESYIVEDLTYLSDFDIHKTCQTYRCIEHLSLSNHEICESGKFAYLDDVLPGMKDCDDRVLMFTQFTMVLDIMEQYLRIRGHKYLRLDGSTPVQERQTLIDKFNKDPDIFMFILSTKAGGLGINLTAANTVILHDLDFNPYNDKQAEDRCHRVGQTRPVRVIRLISADTIEDGIYTIAQEKLKLEQDLTGNDDTKTVKHDVAKLLKNALDVEMSEKVIGDVGKVYTEL